MIVTAHLGLGPLTCTRRLFLDAANLGGRYRCDVVRDPEKHFLEAAWLGSTCDGDKLNDPHNEGEHRRLGLNLEAEKTIKIERDHLGEGLQGITDHEVRAIRILRSQSVTVDGGKQRRVCEHQQPAQHRDPKSDAHGGLGLLARLERKPAEQQFAHARDHGLPAE